MTLKFSPSLQGVVFDLDGTLLDTAPEFIAVVHQLRDENDLERLDEALIRSHVSNGSRALITLTFGLEDGEPGFEEKRQRLLDIYAENLGANTRLYPGMAALLKELDEANIAWGISTNKPSAYAEPLIERMAFEPPCLSLVCPDHVEQPKPHPEPLLLNCKQLGVDPGKVIYVGDHQRDIDAGKAAGMATIAAAYGYIEAHDNPQQWGADRVVEESSRMGEALTTLLY